MIQATWRSGHSWIELKRSHASSWNHADDGGALFRARHFTRHPASGTVLQKIGMTHEGHRGQHEKKWGIYEGEVLYGMLKDDLYL